MTLMHARRRVLILGATSGIATATARKLALQGDALALVARNESRLEEIANDLKVRGAHDVVLQTADLADTNEPMKLIRTIKSKLGGLDAILIFYGVLGDQQMAEVDMDEARLIMSVNFSSTAEWVLCGATVLEENQCAKSVLLTVSSVAGDRGRRSNYVYGAAKGGLSILMQGLAHRWSAKAGSPRAVNMKLGFVDTPMTGGLDKSGPLWAQPEDIADVIARAMVKGGPNVYAPWFWRWVMIIIRMVPAAIFSKINL
jgi:decaprenylphospho-beta-D-erythro-pentofuranosid-2-ulose 2-reductase